MSAMADILEAAARVLRADAALAEAFGRAPDVYDNLPSEAVAYPYITLDYTDSDPADAEGLAGEDVTLTLSVWSRPEPPSIGKREAARILHAALASLTREDIALANQRLVEAVVNFSRVFDDPDGKTRHGLGAVTFLTEPVA